jgi:hypothetical protein
VEDSSKLRLVYAPPSSPVVTPVPKQPRASNRPLLVAAVALAVWYESADLFGGRGQLHEQSAAALAGLYGNEAVFYVGVILAQSFFVVGLGLWLARRWDWTRLGVLARALVARRFTLAGIALLGAVAAFAVAFLVVRLHSTTEDEKTYIFQAKLLLMGRLWVDVPRDASPLWEPFIVSSGSHWSGQYFWAQPALLALGLLAHAAYAVPAAEVACGVFFTGLLVEELSGDRRASLLAAALVATSPIAIMTGATLLNATLSLACAAVTLWSLARLHKGPGRAAVWALGLSTAIGLHNRTFDQVVLLLAAAVPLAVAHFRRPLPIVARLLPAVAIVLPFALLHFAINRAVSGDWRHSGYWLFYQGKGLIMLGFGPGMGGFSNTVPAAVSKTLANIVRMAFYTTGCPFVFAPVAWAIVGPARGPLRAGGWVALAYYGAYLVYTSAPIQTTGPVYFDALVPVLAGCAALGVVRLHDAVRARESLRTGVPAFVLAQLVGAFAIFWPPALLELKRSADDSAACDDLAAGLDRRERAVVFVAGAGWAHRSWTYWKPMPSPTFDDRILFANMDGVADDTALLARYGPDRTTYLAHCVAEAHPKIERFDPKTGRAWAIGAK